MPMDVGNYKFRENILENTDKFHCRVHCRKVEVLEHILKYKDTKDEENFSFAI
jgi:hypothetical protein